MYVQISWASPNIEEARKVAHIVIEARLAACVQIVPKIESIFFWKDKVETQSECLVIFKTRSLHFDKIAETILKNTSYEVPEIIETPIMRGYEPYLTWIDEVTSS